MSALVDAIAFFDAIAGRYDKDYALDAKATRARMAPIVGAISKRAASAARVLDLGVGTGRELPALLDAGFVVTGLDASERMLEQCRKRARPIALVAHDFYAGLPFPDESFDAVLALHGTLGHPPSIDALRRLIDEVARVLAGGGIMVVEAPAPQWLSELEARPHDDGRRAATRVGERTTRHEDRPGGVAVDATILAPDEWIALLEPRFAARVEAISPIEQRIVALKT